MKLKGPKRRLKKKDRKCLICEGRLGRKSISHHHPPREISLNSKITKGHQNCLRRYHFLLKKLSKFIGIKEAFTLIEVPNPVFRNRGDFLNFYKKILSNVKNNFLILT